MRLHTETCGGRKQKWNYLDCDGHATDSNGTLWHRRLGMQTLLRDKMVAVSVFNCEPCVEGKRPFQQIVVKRKTQPLRYIYTLKHKNERFQEWQSANRVGLVSSRTLILRNYSATKWRDYVERLRSPTLVNFGQRHVWYALSQFGTLLENTGMANRSTKKGATRL